MITLYDYSIIGVYLLLMLSIGLIFRKLSKDTSDYFRCGGVMPWWITGTSVWIAGFSAWTFTGAAGMVYRTGTLVLVQYWGSILGVILLFAYTCVRFRRLRVVTYVEALRLRYGPATEQFYTWTKVPLQLLLSAVGLNAIGIFMSAVFRVDIESTLLVMGIVITVVAFAGGAWAVLASDFVQMLLVLSITAVLAYLAIKQPAIGSLSNLLQQVPTAYFDWTELIRLPIIVAWACGMIFMTGFMEHNNMEKSVMYLMTKSDRDARRMVLIPMIGSIIGPLIWFIPPMVARITHPNLAAEFPLLQKPNEAAFVAVCLDVLPQGLLGLLLCAMFGATLTSTDAGLNKGVGVFVRSFFKPVVAPHWPEKSLLKVGKVCTLVFGAIITGIAVLVAHYRTIDLFLFVNQMAASITLPLALPMLFGMFCYKTPSWSAWSTVLVGLAVSMAVNGIPGSIQKSLAAHGVPEALLYGGLTSADIQRFMGWEHPLTSDEAGYALFAATSLSCLAIAGAWFFFTAFFYKNSTQEHKDRVEEFAKRLRTPVISTGVHGSEQVIYQLIGKLCLVFGCFITLLCLIPNTLQGRLSFIFCGGLILIIAAILMTKAKKLQQRIDQGETHSAS